MYKKRLVLAKYLFLHGINHLNKRTSLSDALAILNFHDAVEQVLTIVADMKEFRYPSSFMEYWERAKNKDYEIPNKSEITKLNKIRNAFKHNAILPNHQECEDLKTILWDFFSIISKDLLNHNFREMSLSDFINDDEIKEHIKKAEDYLNKGKDKESINETGIAFAYLMKNVRSDFLEREESFPTYFNKIKHSGITGQSRELRDNFYIIKQCLESIWKRIDKLSKHLNILFLNINEYDYQKFIKLAPRYKILLNGRLWRSGSGSLYDNEFNMNEKNALFCINFVINSVIKFQETSFNLLALHKPYKLKIKTEIADVFSIEEGKLKKIGTIKKGEMIDSAILTYVSEVKDHLWFYREENINKYIKVEDTNWQ